ncbi:Histidine protein methyltransferase 1 homolog [Strongyloides ratti]|uniref:protein-histidine N-methyltransferase n=1 Tax=Strongyloides ratti TaxID=34506 RepID=A0A090KVV4_STRRB|nr:Histidine protein methyltransferase 1 homolog [Strongyloides ratti]CEF60006.1 Histidine protein methyltransferase 1 homolog [Strongyloides ratti]
MPEIFKYNGKTIKYLSSDEVNSIIEQSNYKNSNDLKDIDKSDLVPNIYEGGFKIWECTLDMCNYITNNCNFKGKTILDLGCGAGLSGICALHLEASYVYFQDFNDVVLKCYTEKNVEINGYNKNQAKYISGDWGDFSSSLKENGPKFDVILTTETIYSEQNYEKIYQVFLNGLKEDSDAYILLGGKLYYFGVGGSILGFMDFVKAKDHFNIEVVHIENSSVPRWILKITKKK